MTAAVIVYPDSQVYNSVTTMSLEPSKFRLDQKGMRQERSCRRDCQSGSHKEAGMRALGAARNTRKFMLKSGGQTTGMNAFRNPTNRPSTLSHHIFWKHKLNDSTWTATTRSNPDRKLTLLLNWQLRADLLSELRMQPKTTLPKLETSSMSLISIQLINTRHVLH